MQDALGIKDRADDIDSVPDVRQWITNNGKIGRHIESGQWLMAGELEDYIANKLHIQQKIINTGIKYQNQQRTPNSGAGPIRVNSENRKIDFIPRTTPDELFRDQRTKFIWGVYNGNRTEDRQGNRILNGGNHYTGYLQTQHGIYLFDSRNNTFVQETQAELDDFIMHSVFEPYVAFGRTIPEDNEQPHQINIYPHRTENTDNATRQPAKIEISHRTDTKLQRIRNTIKNIFD